MTRLLHPCVALLVPVMVILTCGTALSTVFTVSSTDDSGAGSLRQAIIDANTDKTATSDALHVIEFGSGVSGTISLLTPLDSLKNHIMINGPGASALTIRRGADITFNIFAVAAGYTVTIHGLTLTNGSSVSGGGIYSVGRLTVSDCAIDNNTAGEMGGAIYSNFRLTVTGTSFRANSANQGGGIYNENLGIATVDNSTFSLNTGPESGAISNKGTLTITNSQFYENSASTGNGGAIANVAELTIRTSQFVGNNGANDGGAIYNRSSGMLIIDSTIFRQNAGGYGGAVENFGTLTVTSSAFIENTTTGNGGGIDNSGNLLVTNSSFTRNVAVNGGGIDSFGPLTVNSSSFSDNTASEHGGGIENFAAMLATNTQFTDNTANDGGGIFNSDFGNVRLLEITISGNAATNNGGGILNRGTVKADSSFLGNNIATNNGGGVFNTGTLTVGTSEISTNSAANGGGIHTSLTVTLNNTTLTANTAGTDGGALYNAGTLTVVNSTIVENTASTRGGGIYSLGSVLPLNSIVAQGTASSGVDIYGVVLSQGHNLIGDADSSSGWLDNDQTGKAGAPINPLLGPLQDNGGPTHTMALLEGSPAINAGSNEALDEPYNLVSDQRGISRKIGPRVDIGAYESPFTNLGVPDGPSGLINGFSMALFPNPASRGVQVEFTLPVAGAVTLELYTITGQRIATVLENSDRDAGTYHEHVDVSALSSGTYILQMTGGNRISARQFVVR